MGSGEGWCEGGEKQKQKQKTEKERERKKKKKTKGRKGEVNPCMSR